LLAQIKKSSLSYSEKTWHPLHLQILAFNFGTLKLSNIKPIALRFLEEPVNAISQKQYTLIGTNVMHLRG